MEIIVSKPGTPVLFDDISVGTGFMWKQWYYMKIEECGLESLYGAKRANAVGFDSGLLAYFNPTDEVHLIPMRVVVDA